jgi:protein-S-isoprenylcysteine O-methyltransferase Ste14
MTKFAAELIWLAGLVAWYVIRFPYERKAKKTAVRKSLRDVREQTILTLGFIGLLFVPLVYVVTGVPQAAERPFAPAVAWAGIACLIAALWVFFRSHAELGRNWSISLELRGNHRLVRTGIYRFIRHPMYSSFFLLGLAQLLLLPNWVGGGAGIIGAALLYALRIQREEKMMLENFGDEYRLYMRQTKRLVPWIV